MTVTVFPTGPEDERIIRTAARPGERSGDVIRRALRLLGHEVWLKQARADARRLADEDLSAEEDAWWSAVRSTVPNIPASTSVRPSVFRPGTGFGALSGRDETA
ncbi:hypothetical protein [Nonomuraea rhodomycinica]|uniref:hypothetical protein n=1 Tax=Nonomuraea rhodomycinica TaxID=1712872 RepID=UPI001C37C639|nr:hypothetical protein [Nonomuraea rhodomycinica]